MQTKDKNEILAIAICGLITGAIAVALVAFGNPANMGFCIACFLRDTAGALKLHNAGVVQYIRPEIIGLVLGSLAMALINREFAPKGGSAPLTRFVLGFFVMIGCLAFLGCPFRMILRLSAGDLNALVALVGFVCGILTGIFFLKRGFSLGRSYKQPVTDGISFSVIQVILLVLLIAAPAFIAFSESGPGSKHAAVAISLVAGLAVGCMAQRTRLCMVGATRDLVLFGEKKLFIGFAAIFVAALIGNIATSRFHLGFEQIGMVAHSDHVWNYLGLYLAGFGCVLLGGCPLRQLILAGEGNSDSAVTVLGLVIGAAFSHNFGLAGAAASKAEDGTIKAGGVSTAGRVAVIIGIAVVLLIAVINTFLKKNAKKEA
ncbi:MAG: YedE-related selenium metabolism membrane protein [Lachnospiraceae bacterium]|nr:YedE-related selenium metabolism membrane protein [Lachnospiraceae bacterium]